MKDKILMLIIGILIGAVIASGCFLLFQNTTNDRGMGSRQDMNQNMIGGGMGRPGDGNDIMEPPQDDITVDNATDS